MPTPIAAITASGAAVPPLVGIIRRSA